MRSATTIGRGTKATKSLAVAMGKLEAAQRGWDPEAYLVKINLIGLSGAQPVWSSGSQPGSLPDMPVVIDMSTKKQQEAGGAVVSRS